MPRTKKPLSLFSYCHIHDADVKEITLLIAAYNLNEAEKTLCNIVKYPQNFKLVTVA